MENLFLLVLVFFMLVGAFIALETANLLSAVISVGVTGFMLSIVFFILGAPDIAITQIVVEILCLIILIRATYNKDTTGVSDDRDFFSMVLAAAVCLVVALVGVKVSGHFPAFGTSVLDRMAGAPSHFYLLESLKRTGAANVITAIVSDFRAYDTLGVVAVFFAAMVGAFAILRKKARK